MIDTGTTPGKAAFAAALAVAVIGACVLAGWLFDLEFLKRLAPDWVAMNPATAVAFVLAGASLALFLQSPDRRDQPKRALLVTARLCALGVTLIGLTKLVAIWFGRDLGVDRWLFASKLADGLPFPNRIAPNTALSFLLLGGALLLVDVRNRSVRCGVEGSVVLAGFGSLLAVLAYAYDIEAFYGLGASIPMALHTAITFSVLSVAFLLSHTDRGLLAVFAGDSAGGTMARRLLPAAVLVPAVFGWLTRQGEEAGLYHGGFGVAAFAVGNILVFTFLVCWSARELFSADLGRRQAEASLGESEARTSLLIKSSDIGLWDWNLGTNEVFFSAQWKSQLGYTEAELPCRVEEWESRLHPEDREPTLAAVKDYCDGRRANYEVEFRLRHKDGSWRWMLTRAKLARDGTGQPVRIMGCHIDITERRRAEEQLRVLATALDATANAIVITDHNGTIQSVNPAFMALTGYTASEAVGRNPRILNSGKQDEAFFRNLWQTISSGQVWSGGLTNRRKDGSLYEEEMTITPLRNADGVVTRYIAIKQDITERKRSEAELEEAHRDLVEVSRRAGMAEIATNVLHNVGNVLNSVNVSTGLIVESVKKSRVSSLARVAVLLREHAHDLGEFMTLDPRGKHVPALLAQLSEHLLADQAALLSELDSLGRNVEHIKGIVAMQQSYATFGGVKELINVVSLVEDGLRLNEGALSRHRVAVIREFETVPLLNVEKHKILQILVNLVRNAKYACDESERADKRLTVRVANGEGRIRVSVMDNGIGIPPENLTRIFSHGFTTRKGGHGFGLHSGALAAREMGGSLTVHSDGPGQGATFTLELPCPTQGSSHE